MFRREMLISIAEIIQETIGLSFSAKRLVDLERGVLAVARELKIKEDIECIYLWITTNKLSKRELQVFASHLTVGETYFFREALSLNLFVQKIIPELISKRADNSKHIRIWCAGCSSGEEPYTLAMLIRENFPGFNSWEISILATDINLNSINKALDGQYTQWSFRETKPEIKHKYFTHKNNLWTISPEIKKMVDFSYLNLAENSFPSTKTNTENIDVIFCRNVLMYFSPENISNVAGRLYSSLIEGGYFITSQVELNDIYFSMFAKGNYENAFYYRKSPKILPDTNILQQSRVGIYNFEANKIKKIKKNVPDTRLAQIKKSISKESVATKQISLTVKSSVEKANESANVGDYCKALEYLDQIIAANAADEDIYYLYGTILYELNKPEEAISKLKKGLYHNPHHLFSHVMLGNFQRVVGNKNIADKYYRNALELLEKWKEEEIVPNSDGITKGRLRIMIEDLMLNQN